jgi:NTE family protein
VISLQAPPPSGDRAVEADSGVDTAADGRPSIGLALGGGAARGFAHIGILETLLAHGLRPHVVTGTSMGAVVGGCYAAGHLASFKEWSLALTRRSVLRYLDVSLSGAGLINGARLARHLETTLGRTRIETLAARFAAIATELDTGHEVWLTRGRLVEALRASYSMPGVFAPVRVGNRWLVDGALVNPVPVSAARALDARVVIAVNLNADVLGRGATIASYGFDEEEAASPQPARDPAGWRQRVSVERLLKRRYFGGGRRPGLPTVMIEAYNVMQDRITRARLGGDPPDIMISPRLGQIGLFDFHCAQAAIQIGAETAKRAVETINDAIDALG